jgi:hypothetical protein
MFFIRVRPAGAGNSFGQCRRLTQLAQIAGAIGAMRIGICLRDGDERIRVLPSIYRPFAAVLLFVTLFGAPAPVSAYEEPKYSVERTYDAFDLRRYAPQLVVETSARGDFDEARREAFMRLFRYIAGANRTNAKISMTVPVTSAAAGEKIAMTVPVTSAVATSGGTVMQFVVPSRYTAATVPQPTDPRISIREIGARLVAARRYSGRSNRANYERELGELRSGLQAAGLEAIGEPLFAVYNGPFTPWFMRRNEVLIEVRARAAKG